MKKSGTNHCMLIAMALPSTHILIQEQVSWGQTRKVIINRTLVLHQDDNRNMLRDHDLEHDIDEDLATLHF